MVHHSPHCTVDAMSGSGRDSIKAAPGVSEEYGKYGVFLQIRENLHTVILNCVPINMRCLIVIALVWTGCLRQPQQV